MPRSTKSRAASKQANADTETVNTDTQENDMTTTETKPAEEKTEAPTFDFKVETLPEDYEPERKNPGRNRTPSPLDDVLEEAYGKGYQSIAHDGNEDKKAAILKELTKAKQKKRDGHPKGYGLDQNVTDTHVEFKVRDLQERKRKPKTEGQEELIEAQGGEDENGDNDE